MLEEALMKAMIDPRRPDKKFITYYKPDEITLETLIQKRKMREELGDDIEYEEVQSSSFLKCTNFCRTSSTSMNTSETLNSIPSMMTRTKRCSSFCVLDWVHSTIF